MREKSFECLARRLASQSFRATTVQYGVIGEFSREPMEPAGAAFLVDRI
jgi:hypothetical protein